MCDLHTSTILPYAGPHDPVQLYNMPSRLWHNVKAVLVPVIKLRSLYMVLNSMLFDNEFEYHANPIFGT